MILPGIGVALLIGGTLIGIVLGIGKGYLASPPAKPLPMRTCYESDQDEACKHARRQLEARLRGQGSPGEKRGDAPQSTH